MPTPNDGLVMVASGQIAPSEIAVDCQSIYWTSGYTGTLVMKAPIGGGTSTALASQQRGQNSIAVDGDFVYWTAAGVLAKVSSAGGSLTPLVPATPLDGGGFLAPQQIVVQGGYVYFTALSSSDPSAPRGLVMDVSTDGGATTTLASGEAPMSIALDSHSVYWVDTAADEVMKTPIGGGPSVTVVGALPRPDGGPGSIGVCGGFL